MLKHVPKLLLILTMLVVPWAMQAQEVQYYRMDTGSDTSMWITLSSSATHVLAVEGEDDETSGLINIGFTFSFGGSSYTQFSCNSNGRLRLGSVPCSNHWLLPFTELTDPMYNDLPFITAFGMDNTLEGSGSHVKYELVGTAPNRILVIEYRTPSEYNEDGDLVNYQIQLLEDSNRVRLVYGTTDASYFDSYQIGLASTATDIMMVNPNTHTTFMTGTSTSFSSWPGAGRYYQFTPQPAPSCPGVQNITLSNATAGTAVLAWSYRSGSDGIPTGYEVVYAPADGSAAPLTLSTSTPSITLTGLSPNTSYVARIRTDCGVDGLSGWDSLVFSTHLLPCLTLDLTTYDSVMFSNGTSTNSGTLVYSGWGNTMCQFIYTASELAAAGLAAGAFVGVDFGFGTNSSFAKEFSIFIGTTSMSSFASSTSYVDPGTLQQVYGPTAHPQNTSGWQHYNFSQPFLWDGVSNIIICTFMNQPSGTSQSNSGFSGYYTTGPTASCLYRYKDNTQFTLANYTTSSGGSTHSNRASIHFYTAGCSETATCAAPSAMVDSVSATEVSISWIPGYNETSWDVEYRQHDATSWTSAATFTSNTQTTIVGLTPATNYDIRVLNICGNDTFYSVLTVLTECVPIPHTALPFTNGFESLTSTGSGSPVDVCWARGYSASGSFNPNNYPYASSSYAHTGSRSLYFYGYSTTTSSWICLPEFEDSVNTLQVAFWAKKSSTSYSGAIKVGVMSDPTDLSTFQLLQTFTTDATTNWNSFDYPLTNASGAGRITILVDGGGTSSNYMYLDDITVSEIPSCLHVQNLTVDSVGLDWACLSWTEMGTSTQWRVEYDVTDFTPGAGTYSQLVYDSSFVRLTTLDTGQTYYVYVSADCGSEYSTYEGTQFTTLAGLPATVPYFCTFEGNGSNGWDFANDPQTNYWIVGNATGSGSSRSLYITNDGSSNAYTISTTTNVYACREFLLTDTGEYAYSYDWHNDGESCCDYIRVALMPGTYQPVAGNSTGWTNATGTAVSNCVADLSGNTRLNLASEWTNRSGTFRINNPGNYKLVVFWHNDGSVGTQPPAAIDNIQIVHNTCPSPINLTASNVTANEATISWSAGGSETSWVVSDGYSQYPTDSTTFTFFGLNPSTQYSFFVKAVCSADDTSMAASVSVLTACGGLTNFPFVEDFENQATTSTTTPNSTFIYCWHHLNNGTTYMGYPYIASSSSYNHTPGGTKGLYWYGTTTTGTYGDYYYVVLPAIDTDAVLMNTMRLSFWAKTSSTSYHPVMNVGVMTDPTDITTYQNVQDININPGSSTAWAKFTTEFDNFTGNGAYIAIRALRPTSTWYVYMDDITLDQIPDCPEVTNMTASNITTESADLNWTETGSATSWTIEYGQHGFVLGNGTTESVYSLPHNIYGLDANTLYDVYITPECSGIPAITYFSFRTECYALDSLPYTMGFETTDGVSATGASNSNLFVECWHRLNNGSDYFGYPYVGSSTYAHTGSRGLYWYNTTTTGTYGDYQIVVLPAVDTDLFDLHDLRLSFWAKAYSNYPSFQVGVMTDPNDHTTFQSAGSVSVTNSSAWAPFHVSFENFNGNGNYVAIRALRASWTAYVDDISLEFRPDCPEVANITASGITTTSANINWVETGEAEEWTIEYGVHGFTPGNGTTETASSHPHTITGLSSDTEYDVYITPVCTGVAGTMMFSFRTECTPESSLPLTMSFESSDGVSSTGSSTSAVFVNCWHRLNNGSQYFGYPYVGSSTTYAHTGSRGLYWYNTTTTGTYGDYQIVVLPAIDSTHPVNTLQLSFWAKASSSSYHPTFQVGVMTDPYDPNSFRQVASVDVGNSATWEEYSTGLAAYTGSGTYVAIRAMRGSWTAYVDDITLDLAPPCPGVIDVATTQVGTTGAVVTWSTQTGFIDVPSSYEIEFTPDDTSETAATLVATRTTYLLSGLLPSHSYTLRIRANCDADGYGTWSDYFEFSTAGLGCAVIDTTDSFVDTIGTGTSTSNYIPSYSTYNYGLSQQIYTAAEIGSGGRITSISVMPQAITQQRTFEIYLAHTSNTSLSGFIHPSDMVRVYDGDPVTLVAGQWARFELDSPFNYNGSDNLLVCFRDMTGSWVSGNYWYVHTNPHGNCVYTYQDGGAYDPFTQSGGTVVSTRNNIIIEAVACSEQATCAPPMVMVDSLASDYMSVNWTAGYEETSWQVKYRHADSAWVDYGIVNTPGYTFTGLQANNNYQVRITAQCTDTNMATTISVTTPCDAHPLPFFTSLENFPSSSFSDPMPSCWYRYNTASTSTGYPYRSTSYAHSGSYGVYMYSTSSSYSYFTLPVFDAAIDSLYVNFWLLKSNTSYANALKVGVMTDPTDINTFTEIATVANTDLYMWEQFEIYLSSYTGEGRYIAFVSPNGEYSYPYLDDITVDYIPACPRIQDVSVSNITLTSAHISWSGGDVPEFDVVCVPAGTNPDLGTIYHVYSEDSVTITGLMASTAYDVFVRGYCYPDTSMWSLGTRFRTLCGMIDSLPFYEDFETVPTSSSSSSAFVPCWERLNNGTTYYGYPYVSSGTSYSHSGGTHGLYWYNTTTTGSYGDYEYVILPAIDTSRLPVNNVQLSFWVKSSSTSYYPVLEVGVMNNNFDTSFTRLRTINVSNSTAWEQYTIPFGRYSGNGNRIAIRALRHTATWYAYVDEIRLDTMPSCPMPMEVVLDTVSTDAIGISWIPSGSETQWQVSYNGLDTIVNDSTSLLITGLTPNTVYNIGVRAICAPGDTSDATTTSARTECIVIYSLPWNDNLESYSSTSSSSRVFVPCWGRFSDATTYFYPYLSSSTTYNHTPSGNMGFYWYVSSSTTSYGSYQTVALPVVDTNTLFINSLQLVFWAKASSTSYNPVFEVGVMTDDDASTFTPVDTVHIYGNTEWDLFEIPFNNYAGYGNRLALRTTYAMSGTYWYAYLDDFTIEALSPCPRPDSLMASNATSSSVTLSWHETGYGNQWVIEYGPRGFVPGTGTQIVTTSNPYTLTGLPSSFEGEFYVRTLCGGGDTATYNRTPCAFSTAQVPASIPYNYDFENPAEWAAWQLNTNTTIGWARGTAVADSGSYSMYVSPNNGVTYGNDNFSSVVNAAAYRDIDFGTIDSSFTITFRAKVGGTTTNTYDALMVFLVDPALPVVTSSANITSPWGNVNDLYTVAAARLDTSWTTYEASFDTIHGVHRVAFFWFNQSTGASYPYIGGPAAVDNIHIDYSSCPRPVNLDTMALTNNTATLHWDGDPNAQYRVAYRVNGESASTNIYLNAFTNHITISGLDPAVTYRAWVQKLCGTDSSLFSDGVTFTTHMCANSQVVQIGSETSTTTSYQYPVNNFYRYTLSETIIDSAEMGGPMDIQFISYYYDYTSPSTVKDNCTIYIQPTTKTEFTSATDVEAIDTATAVMVYTGPLNCSEGWNIFAFTNSYSYDGNGNLMVIVDDNSNDYDGSAYVFKTAPCTSNKTLHYYSDTYDADPYNPSSYSGTKVVVMSRVVMQLVSCGTVPVCRQPIIDNLTHDYESATLSWVGEGNSYEVNIKESSATDWPATDIPVTGTSYTFTGLQPATNYTVRVRQDCTIDTLGYSDWVYETLLTDSLPCLSPDSLAVSAVTNTNATFSWNARGYETMWDLHVWFTGGLDSIYTVTTNPVTVGGFAAGLTYNAAIRPLCGSAHNIVGEWSDTITFTTATCPDVTGFTTSNVTANSVTLNWNPDPMAQSWTIEYGYAGFIQGQGYTVTSTTNSYVVNGLEDETEYDFHIKAVCGTDWLSEHWVNASATTQSGGVTCLAPTGVTSAVAGNSATISWTANTGNISYELEYGPRGFAHGSGIIATATSTSIVLNNLAYETQYDVYVRAICDQNTYSAWSVASTFTTDAEPSQDCDPVQDLAANDIAETSVNITWTPGATGDTWEVVLTDAA
ncbi:MAG: fibronectin type III domain-containing protein, partial [Bacteroidales bacterium]|nr:fibronectin type III domain-containing protein [Bacteroidales bacterium]